MQGIRTPFSVLKGVLVNAIASIKEAGGEARAQPFQHLLENFENDVQRWRELRQADITPIIEEEFSRLSKEMDIIKAGAREGVEKVEAQIAYIKHEQ